ncbi:unnamed protein product [Spirodela intermedia]|uniref:Uncharacterized protein n=1 Tax=Spirodela intermedia TaxID=51605 RepID=A0A7I8IAS8_SPIIN|nr:unnamed protein product [Spirodela intermedia]CAA6654836.1 unnamed protein product [Spirodela intermedia]
MIERGVELTNVDWRRDNGGKVRSLGGVGVGEWREFYYFTIFRCGLCF